MTGTSPEWFPEFGGGCGWAGLRRANDADRIPIPIEATNEDP
jgi:hypothetical protein